MVRVHIELLRVVLAALGVALVVAGWLIARARARANAGGTSAPGLERRDRALTATWIALATLGVAAYFQLSPARLATHVLSYDLVHYYLNAKYFPELGYTRLYEACVVADLQEDDNFGRFRRIRDLRDNVIRGQRAFQVVRRQPEEVLRHFSPERWAEFRHDFRFFDADLTTDVWAELILDRGYNATPTWHLVGSTFASAVPVESVKWVCLIDLALVVMMFGVVARTLGLRSMAIAIVWFTVAFSSRWPAVGSTFLRFDWLVWSVIAACLFAREPAPTSLRRAALAGVAIGLATVSRVFPFLLLFFLALRALHRLVTRRELDRVALHAGGGFVATVVIALGVSYAALGGGQFESFKRDLDLQVVSLNDNQVGLDVALAYRGLVSAAELPVADKVDLHERTFAMKWPRRGIAIVVLGLVFLTIVPIGRRSGGRARDVDELDLAGLSFLVMATLITTSNYYFGLRLVPLLMHLRGSGGSRWDTIALGALFATEAALYAFDVGTDFFRYGVCAVMSIAIAAYALAVVAVRVRSALRPERAQRVP